MKTKILVATLVLGLCPVFASAASATEKIYYPATSEELRAALEDAMNYSGSTIILELEGKDYISDSRYHISEKVAYDDEKDEHIIIAPELTIRGRQGTRLLSKDCEDCVLSIYDGTVTLEDLALGHIAGKDENNYDSSACGRDANVIDAYRAHVTIRNCDLFGCGWMGIWAFDDANVFLENSVIHDCSSNAVGVGYSSKVSFVGCQFSNNGYNRVISEDPWTQELASELIRHDAAWYAPISSVSFIDCDFMDNHAPHFASEEVFVTVENCTFLGNAWDEQELPKSGAMTQNEGVRQLNYSCTASGKAALSGDLAPDEVVMAAMYDERGKFIGVEILSANKLKACLDTAAAKVKLFWLGDSQNPISTATTLWER